MSKILHVDMDAFYASVEQRDDPKLRGRPIVVGGSPTGRGVVAAASYEARAYGIRSAMPAAQAARLCPDLVFVGGDFSKYRAVSEAMHGIFADYTDLIEPLSLDEAYLDVTENKVGLAYASQVAAQIRQRIHDELRLTASAGVAPVKFVAKIASDHRKPNGLTVIPPERVLAFLHPQKLEKLPGVGPATALRLHGLGLRTIGDVYRADERELVRRLGSRGSWLAQLARGEDARGVSTGRARKSRGSERTFAEDITDLGELRAIAVELARGLCEVLQRRQERARTVTLKVRYGDFTTLTRARTLDSKTDSLDEVEPVLEQLLAKTDAGVQPVRLVGVSFSGFDEEVEGDAEQLELPVAWALGR